MDFYGRNIWNVIKHQDLLRWRRKSSSILSHPRGAALLSKSHLENWVGGAGGVGWGMVRGRGVREEEQMPRKLLKDVCGHAALRGSQCNQCASLGFSMCFCTWVSKESRQKTQVVDCFIFFQKFSAHASPAPLGWEVISVSGTKLSGAPSITACKFYLDCDMQHVI